MKMKGKKKYFLAFSLRDLYLYGRYLQQRKVKQQDSLALRKLAELADVSRYI